MASSKKIPISNPGINPKIWLWIIMSSAFLFNLETVKFDFTLDDPLVVSQNIFVDKGVNGLREIWTNNNRMGYDGVPESNYRPFSIGVFALEQEFFGKKPSVHHFFQILYYALCCALVFIFLSYLFKGNNQNLAGVITLLFALHPLHTEVVANIKSRDEIFAMIGIMLTLWASLKYADLKSIKWIGLFVIGLMLALFSKESSLPVILMIPITSYFYKQDNNRSNVMLSSIAIFMAIFYFIMRYWVADTPGPDFDLFENALNKFQGVERYFAAFALLPYYIYLFILPWKLSVDYSFDQLHLSGFADPMAYLGVSMVAGMVYLLLKKYQQKPLWLYGLVFFGAFYSVTSNILFLTGATLAERFMFVPILGLLIAFIVWADHSFFIEKKKIYGKWILGVFLAFFIVKTIVRNRDFKNDEIINKKMAETSNNSARALTKYASFLYNNSLSANGTYQSRYLTESQALISKSLAVSNDYDLTHHVQGLIQLAKGQNELALNSFNKCRSLSPLRAEFIDQTIVVLTRLGREDQISKLLDEANSKQIKSKMIFDAIADRFKAKREFQNAAIYYEKILQLDPKDIIALRNLTMLYRDDIKNIEIANQYNARLGALSK